MSVTFRDIAKRLGVSPSTVSKAVNDREGVSDELRQRILAEIEKMGLRPAGRARLTLAKKTTSIGLVLGSSGDGFTVDPFYSLVIQGVVNEIQNQGLQVVYSTFGADDSREQKLPTLAEEGEAAGLILIGADFPRWFLSEMGKIEIPVVLVDHFEKGMNCVNTDNYGGALQAMEHLLCLGHKKIIHLAGPPAHSSIARRLQGYQRALAEAGLPVREENMVFCGGLGVEQGYAAICSLSSNRDFTAVFAANDKLAIGALRALNEQGYDVPGDVSIVGFDDIEWSRHTAPPLTTVRVAKAQTGLTAAKLLMELLQGEDAHPLNIQIATELVQRQSAGPI